MTGLGPASSWNTRDTGWEALTSTRMLREGHPVPEPGGSSIYKAASFSLGEVWSFAVVFSTVRTSP